MCGVGTDAAVGGCRFSERETSQERKREPSALLAFGGVKLPTTSNTWRCCEGNGDQKCERATQDHVARVSSLRLPENPRREASDFLLSNAIPVSRRWLSANDREEL